MKKLLSLILAAAVLVSCTKPADEPDTPLYARLNDPTRLTLSDLTGYVPTTLEKITDLTEYKTAEALDLYAAAPTSTLDDGVVYMLRNFPAGLGDNEYASFSRAGMLREIEVYRMDAPAAAETIPLAPDVTENLWADKLSRNPDGTFSVTGYYPNAESEPVFHLLHFSADGALLASGEVTYELDDLHMPCGDLLLRLEASSGSYRYSPNELTAESVTTGETAVIAEDVINFTVQDGLVYYLTQHTDSVTFIDTHALYRCDPVTGENEVIFDSFYAGDVSENRLLAPISMAYDEKNGVLCIAEFTRAYAYAPSRSETLIPVIRQNEFIRLLDADDGLLLMQAGSYQVSLYRLPEVPLTAEEAAVTLNIASVNAPVIPDNLLLKMEADGFAVNADTIFHYEKDSRDAYLIYEEYTNTMAKKLLAGDTDFDLVYLSTAVTPTLFREDFFTPLTEYPLLGTYFSMLPDGMTELCSIGGEVCLYPISISGDYCSVSTSLIPDGTALPDTFDEFMQFTGMLDLPDGYNLMRSTNPLSVMMPWLEQLGANYMEKRTDDETAARELVMLFEWALEEYGKSIPKAAGAVNYGSNSSGGTTKTYFPVPKLNDTYGTPYSCGFWAVNPNSENRGLALIFLAYLSEAEMQKESGTVYSADRDYTGGIRTYEISEYSVDVNALMDECLAGVKTTAEAADALIRQWKMTRDE